MCQKQMKSILLRKEFIRTQNVQVTTELLRSQDLMITTYREHPQKCFPRAIVSGQVVMLTQLTECKNEDGKVNGLRSKAKKMQVMILSYDNHDTKYDPSLSYLTNPNRTIHISFVDVRTSISTMKNFRLIRHRYTFEWTILSKILILQQTGVSYFYKNRSDQPDLLHGRFAYTK